MNQGEDRLPDAADTGMPAQTRYGESKIKAKKVCQPYCCFKTVSDTSIYPDTQDRNRGELQPLPIPEPFSIYTQTISVST